MYAECKLEKESGHAQQVWLDIAASASWEQYATA